MFKDDDFVPSRRQRSLCSVLTSSSMGTPGVAYIAALHQGFALAARALSTALTGIIGVYFRPS
jgi:hypothetical protein